MKKHTPLAYFLMVLTVFCMQSVHAAGAKKNKGKEASPVATEQKSVSSKTFSYQVGPRPAFVEEVVAPAAQKVQESVVGDQLYILVDRQMALLNKQKVDYFHYKSKVLTRQALQDASQVYINFNPEYEKLTLHKICLWRNGQQIELTGKVRLDLMQRERNLEKNIYEGDVTALGVLPAVEAGDEIELEYTIAGSNPILGPVYSGIFSISQGFYIQQYSLRVFSDEQRPLNVVAPAGINVTSDLNAGVRRYAVTATKVMPVLAEDNVPQWYNPFKVVQVSEYQSWSQVATWAQGLFALKEQPSADMQQKISEWKASGLSKEALVPVVLRWVQGEIRYFGIELGVNSHLPSKPAETMARRYGDCKDKTLLMHALLTALDIPSTPVLASLHYQRNALKMIPSAAIFDHAILKVTLNGHDYWLDATSSAQLGSLDKLSFYEYGGVLPLAGQVNALENVAYTNAVEDKYTVNYDFKIRSYQQPVELTTRLVTTGNYADHFRRLYQQQSRDEFDKYMQQDLLKLYPQLHIAKPTAYKEDMDNNEVVITSYYTIDQFLLYETGKFDIPVLAVELLQFARLPGTPKREYPYSLFHHARMTQTITLDYPNEPDIQADKQTKTDNGDFWNLVTTTQLQHQSASMSWVLKANKEAVLPQQVDKYMTETKKVREAMGLNLRIPVASLSESEKAKLIRQLRAYNRYGDTNSSRVKAEIKEMINLQTVSKDIASGKLGGENLAKAYQLRSAANEARGDIPAALADIRQAQSLAPEQFDYRIFEAEVLLGDGQFEAARRRYDQLMQAAVPEKSATSVNRGLAQSLYYLGLHPQSAEQLERAKSVADSSEIPYLLIWQYLMQASQDQAKAQETLKREMVGLDAGWPVPVLEMLSGQKTPQQLLAAIDSKDVGIREDHLSEAYFYIGKQYQLAKDENRAKEAFRKCLDQNVTMFAEHNFALHELGQHKQPRKESFLSGF